MREWRPGGGVVVFNLVEGSDVSEGIANLRDALQSVEVFLSKGPGNSIVVGIPAGPMPGDEDLRARARKFDRNGTRNFLFQSLLGERVR